MNDFKFKVGDYIKSDTGLIIKVLSLDSIYLDDFIGEVIKSDASGNYAVGQIRKQLSKSYIGWKLLKGYNTPLWKAINCHQGSNGEK